MENYHAVMLDETGCEFGVDVKAVSYDDARDKLREDYPESRCVQLETPEDALERERSYLAEFDEMNSDEDGDDYYNDDILDEAHL